MGEGEQGGQVVNLAATVEQAGIVFRSACDMVAQSPALDKLLWVRKNIKTIEYDRTHSTLKIMSGERGGGKHGFAISALVFDELAEQSDRELFDTMAANCRKRQNGLLLTISTAGFRRESIAFEQFRYAEKVLSGEIVDISFLPVVHAASPSDDWTSLETFKKVNPSHGVTIDLIEVAEAVAEAQNEPRKEAAYKTLRLNLWTGAATSWLSASAWAACGSDVPEDSLHGLPAWVGYDFAFRGDLAAYVVVVERDNLVYLLPRFFSPRKLAEAKESTDHVPYRHWASVPRYNLWLTDGDVIDPGFIRERLALDAQQFKIREVGYDARGLEESRQIIERELGLLMVDVPQRAKYLGPAASWLERAVTGGDKVRHPKNPILDWCLGNCAAKETPDGLYIHKGSGATQRIDGIQAALIALSRYLVRDSSGGPQVYVF